LIAWREFRWQNSWGWARVREGKRGALVVRP
jgi:hypothetical protein